MSQYTMQTTKMFGVRDGVYWEANLLLDGNKIGTILQEGRGGADRITIYDKDQRRAWQQYCSENGGEERVSYNMMMYELDNLQPTNS
jgi:hypothetical protein